jgi:hypothetical protein
MDGDTTALSLGDRRADINSLGVRQPKPSYKPSSAPSGWRKDAAASRGWAER